MGRYGNLNYAWLTKYGFLAGMALFVLGGVANAALPALAVAIPSWEHSAFFDAEVFGIVIGFVSVFVFGIFLPLTE